MQRRRPTGALPCAVLVGLASTAAALEAQSLESLLREAEADRVRTGCVVLDANTGALVAEHRGDEPFVPASNQKILTAAAALRGLGAEYQFVTRFAVEQGVLRVFAAGDPNWHTGGTHDPRRIFAEVARCLHAAEVHAIRDVQLVPGAFTGPIRPAGWPAEQSELPYCAPTGGLVLDGGCFRARLGVGRDGLVAVEVLAPPVALPCDGNLRLSASAKNATNYSVLERGGRLAVRGTIGSRSLPREVRGAVQDPLVLFELALRDVLDKNDILIARSAPARDLEVLTYRTTLVEALEPMLQDSSNFHAEQVLRALGVAALGDGSFTGGVAALREQLEVMVGDLPAGLQLADGSGLSATNRTSPWLLAAALLATMREPGGAAVLACLAEPGSDGTLRRRFRDAAFGSAVRAKTGWIRGASALSGIVGSRVFSIVMNYDPDRAGLNPRLKALQERMVAVIARGAGS